MLQAGIASPNLFLEIDSSEFDELMGTNLRGAFFVAQQFCRRLVDRGQPGSIVNISSILGQRTGSRQSSYGAAKAALDQLTRNLAMELARSGEPPPNPHHHHHPPTDRRPRAAALAGTHWLGHADIRVNGLAPGYFATEMNADFFETPRGKQYIADSFV